MEINRWARHRFFLYFLDSSVESQYRHFILERAIFFTRVSWIIVIFLGVAFSLLDKHFFGESAKYVIAIRAIIVLVALIALFFSKKEKYFHQMDWNGFVFVFSLGMFCNFLILMDTTEGFSIYFTGLFLIFPGIFCTAGLGFRYSFFAFILTMIGFNTMFGLIFPMTKDLFIAYNVFLNALVFIYIYLGFLVENIFRKNFITSEKLKHSLSQVHQLSGLLPMCSKCKSIRDDKGYWNKIESYIEKHSDAFFSHGMCEQCSNELYGKQDWYIRMKKRKESSEP